MKNKYKIIVVIGILIIICLLIGFVITIILLIQEKPRVFTYSGQSMDSTFKDGEKVFTLNKEIKRMDVIVYENNGSTYIFRVAAIPGDNVEFTEDGLLMVNEKSYNGDKGCIGSGIYLPVESKRKIEEKFKVPNNKYLVIGDNYELANDSRYTGLVDKKMIIGVVVKPEYPSNPICNVNY